MKILLTGATGFLGKIILEELLRKSDEISLEKVFILIRDKQNLNAEQRFEEMWNTVCFRHIPADKKSLVHVISGDTNQKHFALTSADQDLLYEEVTHLIGCAANTNFKTELQQIAQDNVFSVLQLVDVAQKCQNLQVCSHISTAYVHLPLGNLCREELVPLPSPAQQMYDDIVNNRTTFEQIPHQYPNTYALTKSIAEHIFIEKTQHCKFRRRIFRPSIIANAYRYPEPGWTDSFTAYMGYLFLIGTGLIKGAISDKSAKPNIIPVDITAQQIIHHTLDCEGEMSVIKNIVIPPHLQITYKELEDAIFRYFQRYPLYRNPRNLYSKKGLWYLWVHLFMEKLPLWLAFQYFAKTGDKKRAKSIQKGLRSLAFSHNAIHFYSHNTWDFETSVEIPREELQNYYHKIISQGCSEYLSQRSLSKFVIGGRRHKSFIADRQWCRQHNVPRYEMKFQYLLRKLIRRSFRKISVDALSFPERKYRSCILVGRFQTPWDYFLLRYVLFDRKELGIDLPYIPVEEKYFSIPRTFATQDFRKKLQVVLDEGGSIVCFDERSIADIPKDEVDVWHIDIEYNTPSLPDLPKVSWLSTMYGFHKKIGEAHITVKEQK